MYIVRNSSYYESKIRPIRKRYINATKRTQTQHSYIRKLSNVILILSCSNKDL